MSQDPISTTSQAEQEAPFRMEAYGRPRAIPCWVPYQMVSMLTDFGGIKGHPPMHDQLEWCERCGAKWTIVDTIKNACSRTDPEGRQCGGKMVAFNLGLKHFGADWEHLKQATKHLRE